MRRCRRQVFQEKKKKSKIIVGSTSFLDLSKIQSTLAWVRCSEGGSTDYIMEDAETQWEPCRIWDVATRNMPVEG